MDVDIEIKISDVGSATPEVHRQVSGSISNPQSPFISLRETDLVVIKNNGK